MESTRWNELVTRLQNHKSATARLDKAHEQLDDAESAYQKSSEQPRDIFREAQVELFPELGTDH